MSKQARVRVLCPPMARRSPHPLNLEKWVELFERSALPIENSLFVQRRALPPMRSYDTEKWGLHRNVMLKVSFRVLLALLKQFKPLWDKFLSSSRFGAESDDAGLFSDFQFQAALQHLRNQNFWKQLLIVHSGIGGAWSLLAPPGYHCACNLQLNPKKQVHNGKEGNLGLGESVYHARLPNNDSYLVYLVEFDSVGWERVRQSRDKNVATPARLVRPHGPLLLPALNLKQVEDGF